ncbi:MAG: ArnT family glycosyltransferase, partial [Phycisphaerae bacterium]
IYGQIVPLGFMWANLAISRLLGVSEWALRLLPFAAGMVAVPLFWRFATTVLRRRAAFLAVGMLAAAYYSVRHANEVKPYSTDLLVSLALLMLAWKVYGRPRSTGRWIALVILAGLSVWCSYPAVFVAGGVGLLLVTLLIREKFRPGLMAGWVAYALVLSASFSSMYLVYARPHAEYASRLSEINMWAKTFPPILEFWKFLAWLAYIHTGRMFAYPIGGANGASIVTFVLVMIGSVHLWRRERPLLLLLLSPLALTFVAACLHLYPYGGSARTTQYLAPAFCLLAGLGLFVTLHRYFAGPRLAVSLRLAGVGFVIIVVVGIVRDIRQPFKSKPVYRSLAAVRTIATQTGPADRWVVFNAIERVPHAPFLGDWRGAGAQFVFDAMRLNPGTLVWSPPPETVRAAPGETVWLLAYRAAKVEFPEDQFSAYLDRLAQDLGPPVAHRSFYIRERQGRIESLDAYRFTP